MLSRTPWSTRSLMPATLRANPRAKGRLAVSSQPVTDPGRRRRLQPRLARSRGHPASLPGRGAQTLPIDPSGPSRRTRGWGYAHRPCRECPGPWRRWANVEAARAPTSSVFTAPSRSALDAMDYEDAKKCNFEATGKRLSRQTWGLVQKIREVDHLLSPSLQERVRECHTELAFACLPSRSKAGIDDLLDPCVLQGTVCRILHGSAQALPEIEERGSSGLLMQV